MIISPLFIYEALFEQDQLLLAELLFMDTPDT